MTDPNKTKPTPIPCICGGGGGDHGEDQKRQNDFLPGSCEMLCQPADYLAQRRGVGNRGVERPGAGGEV